MKTGKDSSLLWESLIAQPTSETGTRLSSNNRAGGTRRLPYDRRCVAITKSGQQCRGRIRRDSEYCPFHDPELTAERRRRNSAKGGRCHHRLSRLPDGYLRKLTSLRAAGDAMDRLYREVRLGIVTPQMGSVLFKILTRLIDSGFCDNGEKGARPSRRSKADRIRPALSDLLTREERRAWRKAVESAPVAFLRNNPSQDASKQPAKKAGTPKSDPSDSAINLTLTAAS